jgi:hypothetical protein
VWVTDPVSLQAGKALFRWMPLLLRGKMDVHTSAFTPSRVANNIRLLTFTSLCSTHCSHWCGSFRYRPEPLAGAARTVLAWCGLGRFVVPADPIGIHACGSVRVCTGTASLGCMFMSLIIPPFALVISQHGRICLEFQPACCLYRSPCILPATFNR